MKKFREGPSVFYTFYFVIFLELALRGSFLMLYLKDAGMDSAMIGLINGIIQVLSLLTYPIWGYAADRASSKNKVLIFGLILALILLIVFYASTSLLMLAIIMILFSVVHNPLQGIYETITMDHVTRKKWNYSPIRMSGTIGFAVMALVAGFYLSKEKALLFPMFIGAMVLTTFIAAMLPKTVSTQVQSGDSKQKPKFREVYVMLKNKSVLRVLILYGMFSLTGAFNMTYFGIYMSSLGGDYFLLGIANMILAVSEIPFHIGPGRRWMKKIGVEKCLLLVMGVGAVRWTICAFAQNVWILVGLMALNGIMLVPTIVGVVEFLYEHAPDNLKASVQTALRSPFQIGGQLIANVLGGALVGYMDYIGVPGIRVVYACLGPLCLLVGLAVGIPLLRDDRKKKKALQS